MAADVLQRFLTKRLFDVGADDARVKPLRDAAADVAALIKAAPQRTASMTMVAIDSRIRPNEPLVVEVMKILEGHWQSYAGAFTDDKLPTVARAIVLHALSATMGSEPIAAAVSLTARTMLPYLGDQADFDLWTDIIADADRRLGLRAEREWALPSAAKAATGEFAAPAATALAPQVVNKTWLAERLAAASGPNSEDGEASKAPANPQWPNTGEQWSHSFAPIAANAIAGAVDAVIKSLAQKVDERDGAQALRTAIADYVTAAAETLTRTAIGLERRTALLWWKESLYSPSAHQSYRGLDPAVAAALTALDASAQTGAFAPRMAEAMVRETLASIDPAISTDKRTLAACAEAIACADETLRTALNTGFSAVHRGTGRTPLASLLGDADALTPEIIGVRLGLAPDTEVTAIDLGIWLFRDLQAAAATPPPVRRKRGAKA